MHPLIRSVALENGDLIAFEGRLRQASADKTACKIDVLGEQVSDNLALPSSGARRMLNLWRARVRAGCVYRKLGPSVEVMETTEDAR